MRFGLNTTGDFHPGQQLFVVLHSVTVSSTGLYTVVL